MGNDVIKTDVLVIGSGPGGYSAAFRAADLDQKVILVELFPKIGGVCLNVGCIPSKAFLHAAKVIEDAAEMKDFGIQFGKPQLDISKIRAWKEGIVNKLTSGLKMMAKQRQVEIIQGKATFTHANQVVVETQNGKQTIEFANAIIAVGSKPVKLPFIPNDSRIMDSTDALQLEDTQGHLLVLGGGIIGLEMATVYHALGMQISVVEMMSQLIPGADPDIVKPLHKRLSARYQNILLKTKVTQVEAKPDGLWVTFEGEQVPEQNPQRFDRILVAVGRSPNGNQVGAECAGVHVDSRGFIPVDKQMRTNVPHIFAIGDVNGNPMLAHKASAEGRLAAEVIAGKPHYFDVKCIPSVAYTDPEVAWVGVTEAQAKEQNIEYETGVFPWMASGRALSMNRSEGITKLIFNKKGKIIGAGITGVNGGELIAEIALAIEMGCDAEDLALTIHPHPTLSESVMMATEVFEGTITDLYIPKKKSKHGEK